MRCGRCGDILAIRRVAGPLFNLAVRIPVDVERSIANDAVVGVEFYFYTSHSCSSSSSSNSTKRSTSSSHSQQESQLFHLAQTTSTSSYQFRTITHYPPSCLSP